MFFISDNYIISSIIITKYCNNEDTFISFDEFYYIRKRIIEKIDTLSINYVIKGFITDRYIYMNNEGFNTKKDINSLYSFYMYKSNDILIDVIFDNNYIYELIKEYRKVEVLKL